MIFQPKTRPTDPIREEAMAWHVRQEAADLSPADEMALAAWLDHSPEHRAVYAEVDEFWAAAGDLAGHPLYAQTREQAAAAVARTRLTRRALAASFAAALLGVGGTAFYVQTAPQPLATQAFQTAVGQRATVTLPDGSQVTLNTDTVVRTTADEDRRLVYLDKGQAFFKVARDSRHPFVVTAAGRTVTALGTAFDVRVDQGELKVVLVEGKVRVESAAPARSAKSAASVTDPPPMATDMSAGSQLVAVDDTDWRLTATNTDRETSWLKGQLVFDDEALGDIVAEMNRYSNRKITLADGGLAAHRLSGNFTPGDVHGFARMLRAGGVASLREHPSGEIEIVAEH